MTLKLKDDLGILSNNEGSNPLGLEDDIGIFSDDSGIADYIRANEGTDENVYDDTSGNKTVGIGHRVKKGEVFGKLTEQGVEDLFQKDVKISIAKARRLFPEFDSYSKEIKQALTDGAFRAEKPFTEVYKRLDKNAKVFKDYGERLAVDATKKLGLHDDLGIFEKKSFLQKIVEGVKEAGKGALATVVKAPQEFAGVVEEAGAMGRFSDDLVDKSLRSVLGDVMAGPYGPVRDFKRNMQKILGKPHKLTDTDKAFIESSKALKKASKEFIDKYLPDIEPSGEGGFKGFMYNLGSGVTTIGAALGLSFLTKNPLSAAMLFGLYQKGGIYNQGIEAGLSPEKASVVSTLAGGVEGALEYIGLDWMLKKHGGKLFSMFVRTGSEAVQEFSQQISENVLVKLGGIDRARGYFEGAGQAALIGALLGAPASVVVTMAERAGILKDLKQSGFDEKQAKVLVGKILEAQRKGILNIIKSEKGSIGIGKGDESSGIDSTKEVKGKKDISKSVATGIAHFGADIDGDTKDALFELKMIKKDAEKGLSNEDISNRHVSRNKGKKFRNTSTRGARWNDVVDWVDDIKAGNTKLDFDKWLRGKLKAPAKEEAKPKQGDAKKQPKTLTGMIQQLGGIDSSKLKKDYNVRELREQGLGHIFKKGGLGIDEVAQELQSQGILKVPENMNPGDYLIEQIKEKEGRRIDTGEKTWDKEYADYLRGTGQEDLFEEAADTEFDVESLEKESEKILVREINAALKAAGRKSILRTADIKGVIRKETGQNKIKDIIELPETKLLREQLRAEERASKVGFKAGRGVEAEKAEAVQKVKEQRNAEMLARVEKQALLAKLRGEAMVGRKAFKMGKDLGSDEAKAHIAEVKLRKQIRDEYKAHIKKMIRGITSLDVSKMRPEFAEPIQNLIAGLDFKRYTKKTIQKFEAMKRHLEMHPEADIPQSVLDRMDTVTGKSVNDLTYDDFKDIYDTVMHFAHLDNLKTELIDTRYAKEIDEVVQDSISKMKPTEEINSKDVDFTKKSKKDRVKDAGRWLIETLGIRSEHPDLVLETIFGGADSNAYKYLFKNIKDGYSKMFDYIHEREKAFSEELNVEDFTIKDVDKWLKENTTLKLSGDRTFTITRGQKLSLIKHIGNDENLEALLESGIVNGSDPTGARMGILDIDIQKILDQMDDQEKAFIRPTKGLFENQWKELNDVHVETKGFELDKKENYFPLRRYLNDRKVLEDNELLERFKNKMVRIGLFKGMLKDRVKNKQAVVLYNIDRVVADSVFKSGAYIGLEKPLRDASKILYNSKFRSELVNRYGNTTYRYLDKYLRDMAQEVSDYTSTEKMLLSIKNKFTTAVLGLNPTVMAKQVVSYALFGVYVDGGSMIEGIGNYTSNPSKVSERHKKYSTAYRERLKSGYARDVADVLKRGFERRFTGDKKDLQQKVMAGIQFFDKQAVSMGMEGAVIQKLKELEGNKDMSGEEKLIEAYRYADEVVEKTQPMFQPQFRSGISRGESVLERLGTMFSTQLNQNLNLLRRTYREGRRSGDYGKFNKALFLVSFVNASGIMLINAMRNAFFGRDDEDFSTIDFIVDLLVTNAGMLYGIRELAESARSKSRKGSYLGYDISLPVLSVLNDVTSMVGEGARMFTAEGSSYGKTKEKRKKARGKFIDMFVELALKSRGIPYRTPKGYLGAVVTQAWQGKKKKGKRRKGDF